MAPGFRVKIDVTGIDLEDLGQPASRLSAWSGAVTLDALDGAEGDPGQVRQFLLIQECRFAKLSQGRHHLRSPLSGPPVKRRSNSWSPHQIRGIAREVAEAAPMAAVIMTAGPCCVCRADWDIFCGAFFHQLCRKN
jgi:hypothetical protein